MKSIIDERKKCFLCGSEVELERHHCIHGNANRRLAEKDGLWVWLCHDCHLGQYGVHEHGGRHMDLALKRVAEAAWMMENNKTAEDWIQRYGKNWL